MISIKIIKQKISKSEVYFGYLVVDIGLKIISYTLIPFYLWNMPRSVYGDLNNIIAYFIQISQLIAIFCGTHAGFLITDPEGKQRAGEEFGSSLFLLMASSFIAIPLITILNPTLFIDMYVNNQDYVSKTVINLIPFTLFGMAVNQVIQTIAILFNEKSRVVKINAYRTLMTVSVSVFAVSFSDFDKIIENRLIGGLIVELFLLINGLIWINRILPRWGVKLKKVFELIKYGAINLLSVAMFFLIMCLERTAIAKCGQGELTAEYNLILQLIAPINIIGASLIGFWTGDLRKYIVDSAISLPGIKFIKLGLFRNLGILIFLNLLIVLLYLVLKKNSLIPPRYKVDVLSIAVFGVSSVMYNAINMINTVLSYIYKTKSSLFSLSIIIIATSYLKFLMINQYGLIGAASVSVFENMIIFVSLYLTVKNKAEKI